MHGKEVNGIVLIAFIICQLNCVNKNNTDENLNNVNCIDMHEIIHNGMDNISFVKLIQKANWIPAKISGVYLQKDTIQISGNNISVRKERTFYTKKTNCSSEKLIVEFYRVDNNLCYLNEYVFTSEDVSIKNVDSFLEK